MTCLVLFWPLGICFSFFFSFFCIQTNNYNIFRFFLCFEGVGGFRWAVMM